MKIATIIYPVQQAAEAYAYKKVFPAFSQMPGTVSTRAHQAFMPTLPF